MLTGDNIITASSIAKHVGIIHENSNLAILTYNENLEQIEVDMFQAEIMEIPLKKDFD